MSVRLFIAKLPFNTTEADLREYFSQVGPVSAIVLPVDRETGKMRGFAFIDFDDKATAETAIQRLNNGMFKGQTISVSEARPREEKRSSARSGPPHPGRFPPRNRFSGGGVRPAPHQHAEPHDGLGEDRPLRRSPSAGKSGGRKRSDPKAPRGPIRERRSGRFHDLGEDDHDPEEVEFENFATSAPPGEDDSEK